MTDLVPEPAYTIYVVVRGDRLGAGKETAAAVLRCEYRMTDDQANARKRKTPYIGVSVGNVDTMNFIIAEAVLREDYVAVLGDDDEDPKEPLVAIIGPTCGPGPVLADWAEK